MCSKVLGNWILGYSETVNFRMKFAMVCCDLKSTVSSSNENRVFEFFRQKMLEIAQQDIMMNLALWLMEVHVTFDNLTLPEEMWRNLGEFECSFLL